MTAGSSWLLGVISASLICALAKALMPEGPVKPVGRLTCGLVLLAALLAPLRELELSAGRQWLEDYLAGVEQRREELAQTVEQQRKAVIEREYAAYIVDKAEQLGERCTVRVEAGPDGLPVRAEIAGVQSPDSRERLRQILQEDLGLPSQAQFYSEEELP